MIINYIKIALRNLAKHRFFSLLNIAGLALGMSACLTVILIIRDQLSYDHFHPRSERLFRVVCQQPEGTKLATVPCPLGETLLRDFNVAETGVRLVRGMYGADATTADNLTLPVDGFFTESSFFEVFGFQLASGNAATVLQEPNTMVLSKKMAERFFGKTDPIGKTLILKNKGTYRITGVAAEPAGKTHIAFDCLASFSSLNALDAALKPEEAVEKITDNWENWYMSYLYLTLRPGQTKSDLEKALNTVAESRNREGQQDKDIRFFAQHIGAITPKPERYANDLGGGAPWFLIWGLSAFVLILTIFPCLNYASLAIARALARTKEIGVRKAIGARKADVKRLMLTEAVVTALFALVLAWGLHIVLNRLTVTFFPPEADLSGLHAKGADWLIFIAFAIGVGLLAGWIPANRLAGLDPSLALRGNSSGAVAPKSRVNWRAILLVGQFTLSLLLLIVVTTLWSQMRYMTLANYGFQKENLLTVELQGNKAAIVAAEMSMDPHVKGASSTSLLVASNNLQGISLKRERGADDPNSLHCAQVDEHYIAVMGLQLIAGENFESRAEDAKGEVVILNEKALPRFRFNSPAEAIGQTLWINDSTPALVKGVIRDFHYRIMEHGIEPFALRYGQTNHLLHLRLAEGDPQMALAALGRIWKKVDPVHEFKARFMEESMQQAYMHVTFVGTLASFFAVLALSLACMGLLGMVTYTIGTKVKEIGIRKVLGASAAQVVLLLSHRFLILLGAAMVIALPTGYLLSNFFLNLFAYRIAVGGAILGGSAAILILLGLLTIGVQAGRAALANPVDSLRSE
jgi:putative ABC transport system permease protein